MLSKLKQITEMKRKTLFHKMRRWAYAQRIASRKKNQFQGFPFYIPLFYYRKCETMHCSWLDSRIKICLRKGYIPNLIKLRMPRGHDYKDCHLKRWLKNVDTN